MRSPPSPNLSENFCLICIFGMHDGAFLLTPGSLKEKRAASAESPEDECELGRRREGGQTWAAAARPGGKGL